MSIKQLKILTIGYFLLPNIIFIASWLNPIWATLGCLTSLYSFYLYIIHTKNADEDFVYLRTPHISIKSLIIIAVFTIILGVLFSLGNFGFGQSYDYFKHNTIVKELIEKPFPITYSNANRYATIQEPAILGYYIAYYLPTAVLSKILGIGISNIALFVSGAIGIFISFIWIYFLTPKNINIIASFVAFLLATSLFKPYLYAHYLLANYIDLPIIQYFIWPSGIAFNLINIHYSPQHYLVSVIGVCWIYYECFRRKDNTYILYFIGLLMMWSFLGAFSVGIFGGFLVLKNGFRAFFSKANLLGGGLLLFIMASYFLAHFQDNRYSGFIWTFEDISGFLYQKPFVSLVALVGYCILEMGVYLYFMYRLFGKNKATYKNEMVLLFFCIAYFTISPIYRLGFNNDTAMRLISTIKIVIFLLLLFTYSEMRKNAISTKFLNIYLSFAIILGIFSSITTLKWDNVPSIQKSPSIEKAEIPQELYLQYFAKKELFFRGIFNEKIAIFLMLRLVFL